MTDAEKCFGYAVQLAAGFVANGDIRLGRSARPDDDNIHKLHELIEVLFVRVAQQHAALVAGAASGPG